MLIVLNRKYRFNTMLIVLNRNYCSNTMLIVLKQYLRILLSYDCFMQSSQGFEARSEHYS